jgi:hypothetical protein
MQPETIILAVSSWAIEGVKQAIFGDRDTTNRICVGHCI